MEMPAVRLKAAPGYVPALDGVRAVAELLMLSCHLPQMPFSGGHAFDIFMVLSGYLMTGMLLREYARTGSISFRRFWLRRELRLLPPIWVMLLVTVIAVWR